MAQRIQSGMQHVTDLKPHERDTFLAARKLADDAGVPLVAALEDYLRARQMAGSESLAAMAAEYSKYFGNVTRRATVPEVVVQLLESRKQDRVGTRHLAQLRSVLNRFAAAHPGQILDVTSTDIDAWLRSLKISPSSRNGMLRYVSLLFSFALERNYLPEGKPTAPSQLRKVKVVDSDIEVFTPDEFRKIIHAAPIHLIPLLAISAFAGIRAAELGRLDWSAVDLERRHIEMRAGQAKTASRRLVPITDNLATSLEPLPRNGRMSHPVQSARRQCLTDAEWFCRGRSYCHPLRGRHVLLRGTKRKIRGKDASPHTSDSGWLKNGVPTPLLPNTGAVKELEHEANAQSEMGKMASIRFYFPDRSHGIYYSDLLRPAAAPLRAPGLKQRTPSKASIPVYAGYALLASTARRPSVDRYRRGGATLFRAGGRRQSNMLIHAL